ncbi:putative secondary metabolism biosynthetic enzyme [Tricholoma furcatifolium]|nr:putative secondary metabolism biosynthetic enzyme [Tricholoma furcatifolium]
MPSFDAKSIASDVAKALSSEIKGKRVIVTGITLGGLGAEAARVLVSQGAEVVLAGRSSNKIKATADAIRKEFPDAKLKELIFDLNSQASLRKSAAEVLAYEGPVDVVILNAGIMGTPYARTEEGLESQFGNNHIGNFLFTNLILPKVLESPSPRVVSVASVGHFWGPVIFDNIGFDEGKTYDKWAAYGQSKTANILFAVELAERYKNTKLKVFSLHPGGAATSLHQHMTKEDYEKFSDYYNPDGTVKGDWVRSVEEVTSTHIIAGFDLSIADQSGSYLVDCKVANEQAAPYATDKDNAKRLWELSEKIVGQKF